MKMGCGDSKPAVASTSPASAAAGTQQAAATTTAAASGTTTAKQPSATSADTTQNRSPTASATASNVANNVKETAGNIAKKGQHHVRNIFAKPLQDLLGMYHPPVFPKSNDEINFLKTALPKNFVFEQLKDTELLVLAKAMEKISFSNNDIVIKQGDSGDFFYVIQSGTVDFIVDDKVVGSASDGASFGELSLLYTTPRAATVKVTSATADLYKVDQTVFRYTLQQETVSAANQKSKLLKKVTFLKDLDDYSLNKLSEVMTPIQFKEGDIIMKKGDVKADHFYIIENGSVELTDVGAGSAHYEDFILQKNGDYFGELALVTGEPRAATITALKDTLCFTIDKKTFDTVLGDFKSAIVKSSDKAKVSSIKIIADSKLNAQSLAAVATLITDKKFTKGTKICEIGKSTEAALYLVREGSLTIEGKDGTKTTASSGGYFGEDLLKADIGSKEKYQIVASVKTTAEFTATADEDVVCGVLPLGSLRRILDTRHIGTPQSEHKTVVMDSIVDRSIPLEGLKKHAILGQGTFGQVWLVSRENSIGERVAYALKVQSKYELVKDGQAKAVVYEKNIMTKLHHPFLITFVNTYQDDHFVYILLQLIQGGELYNYIHTPKSDFLSEKDTRFYAACVAEGLGFMHRRGFCYRDLKAENVLVDDTGYCVIIDFGFAKYVPSPAKTFTLCGTPLYLPPEVILNRGHNASADHWSLGILIYEMLTGETPFYQSGMDQMDLFRSIVKGKYMAPMNASPEACDIISRFLTKDPYQRLGSLAGGEDDVVEHAWFAKKPTLDFDELRLKTIKAPKIPKIKDPLDASNFEDWSHLDDKTKMKFPKLKKEEQNVFAGF